MITKFNDDGTINEVTVVETKYDTPVNIIHYPKIKPIEAKNFEGYGLLDTEDVILKPVIEELLENVKIKHFKES